jgi:hypothetical protein
MRRRTWSKRALKWTGAALCLLVLALWFGSIRFPVMLQWDWSDVALYRGSVTVNVSWGSIEGESAPLPDRPLKLWQVPRCVWSSWNSYGFTLPNYERVVAGYGRGLLGQTTVTLPLWIILVVCLIPTLIFAWLNRAFPPGRCRQCGYDLRGNVGGVCPECGTPTDAKR